MNGTKRDNMQLHDDRLIILTGGAGFIGSCILKQLNLQKLYNVVVVDRMGSGIQWHNLVGKKFIEYLDKDALFDWLNEPSRASEVEAIIHMGACSSTVETNVDYLMENNYRYSVRLAEYALKHNIKFIYASSAATYGDGALGFDDNENRLDELRPMNPYGYSKHLFDLWAKNQDVLGQITGLKFFNVFGPNEYHKERMASVVFGLLPQIQKERVIRLFKSNDPKNFKDGEQRRDFIYVKDVAKIVVQLLKADIFGLYNLGSGTASTWNELAHSMFSALKMPVRIEYRAMPEDLNGKYQNYTKAEMAKLISQMPNIHFTSLKEAIDDYINNYLLPHKTY